MKNAGISPAIIQEFVGHDSKAVSQKYTHIETGSLRKAADALPGILEGILTLESSDIHGLLPSAGRILRQGSLFASCFPDLK